MWVVISEGDNCAYGPFETRHDAQDFADAKQHYTWRRLFVRPIERPY